MSEVGDRRPALFRIPRERAADGDVDPRWNVGEGFREFRRRRVEVRGQHRHRVWPAERHPAVSISKTTVPRL